MAGTFTLKQLRFTFTLANNAVFANGANVLTVVGLRAIAIIKGSGLPAFPEAELTVYGMKQADMIALTALAFQPLGLQRNTVTVEANSGNGWSTVFMGQIITAGPDFTNIPAAMLKMTARVLGYESLAPAAAASYPQQTSVATIVANLASKLGYAFENNGVAVQLNNPYFSGTLAQQLRAVVQQAGIDLYIEGNVIAICPKGVPRSMQPFVLSPSSGLVGYPKLDYNRGFVNARAVFNSGFHFGGPITVQDSAVVQADGSWVIGTITNALESQMPGGAWFSDLLLYPPNSLPPIQ
jgi:hypothetical protein